mgnify:CR=1 FL=1
MWACPSVGCNYVVMEARMPCSPFSHIAMLCTTYSNVDVQEFNLSDILTNTVGYHVKFVVSLYS